MTRPRQLAPLLAASLLLAGCSAAARSDTEVALNTAATFAPVACKVIAGLDPSISANACGDDAAVLSDVARTLSAVLQALPPTAGAHKAGAAVVPGGFRWRGVTVSFADDVVARAAMGELQRRLGGQPHGGLRALAPEEARVAHGRAVRMGWSS